MKISNYISSGGAFYEKILLFLCLVIVIIISACSNEQDPNLVKVSKSSDEIVGENYQTVISDFEEMGFTNIETKVLDDLITGWLTKDGEIEQVEINGVTDFSTNDSFQKDSKVVITYHTFPEEEKSETEPTDEKSSGTIEQSTNESSVESNQEILTDKNNEDLAAVWAVKDESHPIIGEFVKKYVGRIIEFDGNIANMMQHENYTTRYDILIYAGDYSETTFSGPNFKFEDVSVLDLNLTGSEISENIGMGQNLLITAVVEEYNEDSGLFMLEPISTEIR
ncbi:DUF4839 domain-containing protein [Sutcliffiella horikoshii]|uniref:DUF4839 domain-containing protein n=1 Tax=Sutcliffiella horikoshii TaxID=79883 RepID=UPI003CF2A807